MISQHTPVTPTSINTDDLSAIRLSARQNSPDALRKAAQQFEALFMNMVLKSMRKTTFESGLFDNSQSKMYTSILDQELSQVFSKRGIGLADALVRQLQNNNRAAMPDSTSNGEANVVSEKAVDQAGYAGERAIKMASSLNQAFMIGSLTRSDSDSPGDRSALSSMLASYQAQHKIVSSDVSRQGLIEAIKNRQVELVSQQEQLQHLSSASSKSSRPAHVQAFIAKLAPYAEQASRETGIPAKFMLGQAALETGWGQKEIALADGSSSHNLFGIKAGRNWSGNVARSSTTEYENGVAVKRKEPFRAYNSYADSFKDYARLISTNPRYRNVLESGSDAVQFAQGLQDAGYATDPKYAAKLARIIQTSMSG